MIEKIRPLLAISRSVSLQVASALLFLDLLVILFGVFMRYVVGGAPIWTDELARFLIIGSVMIAAGAAWIDGAHMRVNVMERLLPMRFKRILQIYQWLLIAAIAIGAAVFSYQYANSVAMFKTQGLGISRTIPMLAMPIGFALLAWQVILGGPFIADKHALATQARESQS